MKDLLQNSQVTNTRVGKTIVRADSIHFSNKLPNAKDLIIQAREIIEPLPYNYKKALKSGWITTGPRVKQLEKLLADYVVVPT